MPRHRYSSSVSRSHVLRNVATSSARAGRGGGSEALLGRRRRRAVAAKPTSINVNAVSPSRTRSAFGVGVDAISQRPSLRAPSRKPSEKTAPSTNPTVIPPATVGTRAVRSASRCLRNHPAMSEAILVAGESIPVVYELDFRAVSERPCLGGRPQREGNGRGQVHVPLRKCATRLTWIAPGDGATRMTELEVGRSPPVDT